MIVLAVFHLLLAVPSAPAAGSALGDSVVLLPEVSVERARAVGDARRRLPTASVTELETGASGRALETLAELLSEAAGVRVQQYGGLGAFSTVSLRGAPPGQVSIFLDGAPLSAAAHSVISLGDLPATAIERIEVYRGSSPLGMGPAAPGGAINLVSVTSPELRSARVMRGAFGTWEARGFAGARRGGLSGLIHAGHQRSRGDFRYPDDNGTPFNFDDDSLSPRVNNRFAASSLLGSAVWQAARAWRIGARTDLFRKEQGVPGLGAVPAYDTHLGFTRGRGRLDISRAGAGTAPGVRIAAGLARERTRFRDPSSELGLGYHDTDDRTGGGDLALDFDWRDLPHGLAITGGGAMRREWSRPTDATDEAPDPPPSRRLTAGGHATLQWRPRGERFVLHLAARRDRLRDRIHWLDVGGIARATEVSRTLDAPQFGMRVLLPAGFEVRGNVSSAARAPDFLELFGNQGSVLGNPTLRPERSRNGDLGLAWAGSPVRRFAVTLDLAHFETRAEDLVVYVRHSQSSVRAENISRARMSGEELSLRITAPRGIALTGGLTRLSTRDQGPVPHWHGRRLPLRPVVQGFTRFDWRRGGFRAVADLHYIGDDFLDRANLQRVPDRLLAGASLSFSPAASGLRFTVEGKNLGDDRVFDVGGFPLPGRAVFASCDLRLGASPSPDRSPGEP
jgi:iron complex outermembrane receptor protein